MSRSRITMNEVEIRSQEYCVLGWVCQNDVMLNNLLPVGLLVTIIEPRDFMTDSLNITYMASFFHFIFVIFDLALFKI